MLLVFQGLLPGIAAFPHVLCKATNIKMKSPGNEAIGFIATISGKLLKSFTWPANVYSSFTTVVAVSGICCTGLVSAKNIVFKFPALKYFLCGPQVRESMSW